MLMLSDLMHRYNLPTFAADSLFSMAVIHSNHSPLLQMRECLYDLVQMTQQSLEQHYMSTELPCSHTPAANTLHEHSEQLLHTSSTFDRCNMVNGAAAVTSSVPAAAGGPSLHVCLLKLDHMHNRAMYTKTIKRWAAALQLSGRLIFFKSVILIALEGAREDLNEYLRLQRTECVDVDSRGRKCKERMMDIIASVQPHSKQSRCFQEFGEVECSDYQHLESILDSLGVSFKLT